MDAHLIDNFKVDAKSRRGVQATDFPLTRATNTKLLEMRSGVSKGYIQKWTQSKPLWKDIYKNEPKANHGEKPHGSRAGHS